MSQSLPALFDPVSRYLVQGRSWDHAGNCLLLLHRNGNIGMPRQFHLTGLYKTDFITYYHRSEKAEQIPELVTSLIKVKKPEVLKRYFYLHYNIQTDFILHLFLLKY